MKIKTIFIGICIIIIIIIFLNLESFTSIKCNNYNCYYSNNNKFIDNQINLQNNTQLISPLDTQLIIPIDTEYSNKKLINTQNYK